MNQIIHPDRPRSRPRGMSARELVAYELLYGVPQGECILASCHLNNTGYAHVQFGPRMVLLHRLVLENKMGRELGARESRHLCHRTACINPDHLAPGSHADNMADMVAAGRGKSGQRPGERNSACKLTEQAVRVIRTDYARGLTQSEIASQWGVSPAAIGKVVRDETWQGVR